MGRRYIGLMKNCIENLSLVSLSSYICMGVIPSNIDHAHILKMALRDLS